VNRPVSTSRFSSHEYQLHARTSSHPLPGKITARMIPAVLPGALPTTLFGATPRAGWRRR
jgi:hypothetical protein